MTITPTNAPHFGAPDAAIVPLRIVVVSAGVSDPSTTRLLADRAAQ